MVASRGGGNRWKGYAVPTTGMEQKGVISPALNQDSHRRDYGPQDIVRFKFMCIIPFLYNSKD